MSQYSNNLTQSRLHTPTVMTFAFFNALAKSPDLRNKTTGRIFNNLKQFKTQ